MTTSNSVGSQIASEYGLSFAKRDIFIDNVLEKEKIRNKLLEAAMNGYVPGLVKASW